MTSYGFCFRPTTRKDRKGGRLYLRVVHGGESRSVTTDYWVYPDEWDPAGRRIMMPYGHSERSQQLMEYQSAMHCDTMRLDNIIKELARRGAYTIDEVMDRYRSVMFGNALGTYTEHLATDMEREKLWRTARGYRTAATRFIKFLGKSDIKLENLSANLIGDFQQQLKAEGMTMNTISFYMRTLRSIYNKAVADGRIPKQFESPFQGAYTGLQTTRKLALTAEELAILSALDPTLPKSERQTNGVDLDRRLQEALAMFLFCYHARGMCFVDMCTLKKRDIRDGRLKYKRRKTGQMIELAVHPTLRRILDWFSIRTRGSDYLFPIISGNSPRDINLQYTSGLRVQNQRLKRIATMVGIDKHISTHSARHSWATVAKNEGLPLAVISEGLGHTNQKTTEIYLASMNRQTLDKASRQVSDAIKPGYTGKGSIFPRGRANFTQNIRFVRTVRRPAEVMPIIS